MEPDGGGAERAGGGGGHVGQAAVACRAESSMGVSESQAGGGTRQEDRRWERGEPGQTQGAPENSSRESRGPEVPAGPSPSPQPSVM